MKYSDFSDFLVAYFLPTTHIVSLFNLTLPLSSEYFFAASVTLFHISSCLDLVSLASVAITGAAIAC